ncbi:MAG TPA: PilN domain-containing protein [Gammaproteobacteria bacterium]
MMRREPNQQAIPIMQSETEREADAAPARLAGWMRRLSWGRGWSGAGELLRWWQGQLRAMVPAPLRVWGAPPLRVEASATELRLIPMPLQAPITVRPLNDTPGAQRHADDHQRCELVLDAELGLAIPVTLPEAAEENLRRVIGFSMDRYTPFTEEEVYFDYRISQRDRARQRIELILHVVPRATLDRLVQHLADERLEVVSADIAMRGEEGSGRAGVNLLPLTRRSRSRQQARINMVLGISALVLLLAVAIIPLYQRHQQVHAMEVAIDGLRPQVHAAELSRADVTARSEMLRAIVQRRDATPPVLNVLRELTRLTPDEAWAGQVELKEGRIRLTGEASAGSELMEALTASDYFADPRFEAPLTQNPKSGRERFVLSVAIKESSHAP